MENTIYVGLSRQLALQEHMQIVSNNIANMTTAGYRGQNMMFTEYLSNPRGKVDNPKDPLSMVLDYGQYQTTRPGPIKNTGNPLDVALSGPGFFGVQTKDGLQYTRAGNFALNANGELVTAAGLPVAGSGGGAIVVPRGVREVKIAEDGTVSTDQGQVGQLMITEFDNLQELDPAGDNTYKAKNAGRPATDTKVMQGMVEGSNVQPVVEMSRMIEISREYQSIQRMLQTEHDRQRTTIQRLSQRT